MILIDDEEEPSINGTGAEDYFNHAWGMQRNQSPYNGTIMHDGDTKGYQVSYRFHLTDPIHIKKHIQISMEHGHANHLSDDWSCTAYWYQAAPVTSVTIQPVLFSVPFFPATALSSDVLSELLPHPVNTAAVILKTIIIDKNFFKFIKSPSFCYTRAYLFFFIKFFLYFMCQFFVSSF